MTAITGAPQRQHQQEAAVEPPGDGHADERHQGHDQSRRHDGDVEGPADRTLAPCRLGHPHLPLGRLCSPYRPKPEQGEDKRANCDHR